jgi:hypothetical protein
MNLSSLLSIVLVSFFAASAEKPVVIKNGSVPESILSKEEVKLSEATMYCHLQKHIAEHTSYIQENVFSRIERELEALLKPQKDKDGNIFYITEKVSYGDLFHAHIRSPLTVLKYGSKTLDKQFKDNQSYHLQYHSYEYIDYLIIDWVKELEKIDNQELQKWLKTRNAYVDEMDKMSFNSFNGNTPEPKTKLNVLSEEQRAFYTALWDQALGKDSPSIAQLGQKIRFIDPKDYNRSVDILSYRSVVSTLNQFTVIRPLNLKDYTQPATVYFEELSDSPLVKAVIEKAKGYGMTSIINRESKYFNPASFTGKINWDLNDKLMEELVIAAKATTAKNPSYMFGHAYESVVDRSSHVVIGWSDKYLFSIRYFIPCDEKEKALALPQDKNIQWDIPELTTQ